MCIKKQRLELDMEQVTSSKLGKEYGKVTYCHNAYLTYMHIASCQMLGWMNHKVNKDFWEKYQQLQICRFYHSNGSKVKSN